MGMESVSRLFGERLGHECGEISVLGGDFPHKRPESHDAIRRIQRLAVAYVHFHLPGSVLGIGLLERDPHHGQLAADRANHVLHLRSADQAVELVSHIDRAQCFRIKEIELQFGTDKHPVSLRLRPGHLVLEHAPRIDRDRLVVHPLRASETECAPFLPRHRIDRAGWNQVHVRIPVPHVDVGRIPHVAGHVAGERRDGEGNSRLAHFGPAFRGYALAPHHSVQVAQADCHRVHAVRKPTNITGHNARLPFDSPPPERRGDFFEYCIQFALCCKGAVPGHSRLIRIAGPHGTLHSP